MINLDDLAWYSYWNAAGGTPLGFTPKYCHDCGGLLEHQQHRLSKSLYRYDPRTGKPVPDSYLEHVLGCPRCGLKRYTATSE